MSAYDSNVFQNHPQLFANRSLMGASSHITGADVAFVNGVYSCPGSHVPFRGVTAYGASGTLVVHLIGDADNKYLTVPLIDGELLIIVFDKIIQAGTSVGLLVAGVKFWM